MAHALELPSSDPLFKARPKLTVAKGGYTYTVELRDGTTKYSVSDGTQTISVPVRWIFGANSQTYVLERDGQFYESLVSYWKAIDALDTTVGDQAIQPKNLAEAFGRPLANSEVTLCFGCHSTGTVTHHHLHLDGATPGVTCAHCHAGSEAHLASISQGKVESVPAKLERLSAEEISSFCGQCHRTWETVVRNHWVGPMNVRFQPYRLALSQCFDGQDKRLSCVACHDPHQEVMRDNRSYDAKCLACHSASAKLSAGMIAEHPNSTAMRTCPISKTDCVRCHMPRVDLPGGHQVFTDHYIRIVGANEAYPH
jgi:Zn finger protein HypA/HybF involved in hydrogenase expression